jgi:hypothetical protein
LIEERVFLQAWSNHLDLVLKPAFKMLILRA